MSGLSGEIAFDSKGLRTNLNLDLLQLNNDGLLKVFCQCTVELTVIFF